MARQKKVVLTTAQEMDKVIADIERKEEELKALKQKKKRFGETTGTGKVGRDQEDCLRQREIN